MLTKLVIRNFKRFEDVEIPLASPVVFVGPNNSGKTTALQALALWGLGLRRWREKRAERSTPEKRPGVAINRRDLISVPIPSANLLWRSLRTRNVQKDNGKQKTQNIRIDVLVEGTSGGAEWRCGLEFDFANEESLFCRPLRSPGSNGTDRMPIPEQAYDVNIAYLPPMSGLMANETRLDAGAISVRLGEGRTAEVLRNLCYALSSSPDMQEEWRTVSQQMRRLFNVELGAPEYIPERGEIQMGYRDQGGVDLDLSSSGRGLQQTLLLLSYLSLHPASALLLDEPDAHLEILRQREIYEVLNDFARAHGSQLIIASHSEEILNQAAGTSEDSVVAFLGKPHRIPKNRTASVRQALSEVRFDQYYLAEQVGWVLYLEDRTDLTILRAFAERLQHAARMALESPFLCPIGNQPNSGRKHFSALAEAKPDLRGYLLVDSDAPELQGRDALRERKWRRREIENYLCQPQTLEAYAGDFGRKIAQGPLFEAGSIAKAIEAMQSVVADRTIPAALRDPRDLWWTTVKASDDFLDLVLPAFFTKIESPVAMKKANYHELVQYIPKDLISQEVIDVLDEIHQVAQAARPVGMSFTP